MKAQRPGDGGATSAGDAATAGTTPGKRTLVEGLQGAPPAAAGPALDIGAGPQVEGGTLFSGPDHGVTATG